jgi:hypothetical protein
MLCYIYLKLQIEVKFLLDNRIYTGNQIIILKRNRENFYLEVAKILNVMIDGLYVWRGLDGLCW